MFIKIYSVVFFHSNPGLQWSMILYKYLFVWLTSSADLQPCLSEEERESQQALQHHVPREQSPLLWQALLTSRFWPLVCAQWLKTWEEVGIVGMGSCMRAWRSCAGVRWPRRTMEGGQRSLWCYIILIDLPNEEERTQTDTQSPLWGLAARGTCAHPQQPFCVKRYSFAPVLKKEKIKWLKHTYMKWLLNVVTENWKGPCCIIKMSLLGVTVNYLL